MAMRHNEKRSGPWWGARSPLPCMDAHIHLDLYSESERRALLKQAAADGVFAMVAVSMGLSSCMANAELAKASPGLIFPAYGWHPEQEPIAAEQLQELLAWIRSRHAAGERFAIGEVGLPYYKRTEAVASGAPFDEAPYTAALERFIVLAAELDLPVVLHAVYEDADKAMTLLRKHGIRKAHFHWFKGSQDTVLAMAEAGYFISVTPDVAYENEIQSLVKQYPLEQMMTETDGPWPFEGPYNGHATEPSMTRGVIADIAAIKGLTERETADALLSNAKRFYGLR